MAVAKKEIINMQDRCGTPGSLAHSRKSEKHCGNEQEMQSNKRPRKGIIGKKETVSFFLFSPFYAVILTKMSTVLLLLIFTNIYLYHPEILFRT